MTKAYQPRDHLPSHVRDSRPEPKDFASRRKLTPEDVLCREVSKTVWRAVSRKGGKDLKTRARVLMEMWRLEMRRIGRGKAVTFEGADGLAEMAKCSPRQAERELSHLTKAGVLFVACDARGGRRKSAGRQIDFAGLLRWLEAEGAKPTKWVSEQLSELARLHPTRTVPDTYRTTSKKPVVSNPIDDPTIEQHVRVTEPHKNMGNDAPKTPTYGPLKTTANLSPIGDPVIEQPAPTSEPHENKGDEADKTPTYNPNETPTYVGPPRRGEPRRGDVATLPELEDSPCIAPSETLACEPEVGSPDQHMNSSLVGHDATLPPVTWPEYWARHAMPGRSIFTVRAMAVSGGIAVPPLTEPHPQTANRTTSPAPRPEDREVLNRAFAEHFEMDAANPDAWV